MDSSFSWNYLAEGNLHLILSYAGQDQQLQHKVLRFIKHHSKSTKNQSPFRIKFQQYFASYIPNNLQQYTQKLQPFKIDNLDELCVQIEQDRPEERRTRQIDKSKPIYIMENLFSNKDQIFNLLDPQNYKISFNVEIKPKSGNHLFIHNSPDVTKFELVQIKKAMDKYKVSLGEIKSNRQKYFSLYDPQNLFSDDVESIRNQINNLMLTPQNNFKFFYKGKQLKGEEMLKIFSLHKVEQNDISKMISKSLKNENILHKIKEHQKVDKTVEQILKIVEELDREQIQEQDFVAIQQILEQCQGNRENFNQKQQQLMDVIEFLKMITWSDISIVLNISVYIGGQQDLDMKQITEYRMDKMNEYRLVYKTSVIDNELKDVESIEKYYKQSMELKDLYNQYLQS